MSDDLKRDMGEIPLLFVCLLEFHWAIATLPHTFSTTFIIAFIIARRSPAAGDDLKRNMAPIPLLFVMRDDLKRDMAQILLLFVILL